MPTIEERLIQQATVEPHWLTDRDAFWYRRQHVAGKTEFILVDAAQKTRGPAFDHAALADVLGQQTGTSVDADDLPFSWIEVQPDHAHVCFQYGDKKWQFRPDGVLEEWQGDFAEADPRFLKEEAPSSSGSNEIQVKLINQSGASLSVFWIDFSGNPVHYMSNNKNQTTRFTTYSGHVWKFVDQATNQTKLIYRAPKGFSDTVVIGNNHASLRVEPTSSEESRQAEDGDKEKENATGNSEEKETVIPVAAKTPPPAKPNALKVMSLRSFEDSTRREVIVEDHNLYLKEKDGRKIQLAEGSADNIFDQYAIYLTSDEQFAIVWQYTPEQTHTVNLIESAPKDQLEPKLKPIQYLKPGDRRRVDRPRLYDLTNACEIPTDSSSFANPYNLYNVGWNRDGQEYRFIFNERGHQRLRVLSIHRSGSVKVLIEEQSNTFIDYSQKLWWTWIEESDEMLWASERDGFNHLYLFDLSNGTEPKQLTQGTWNVREVEQVDQSQRRLLVRAYGVLQDEDPYHSYLVSVNFDGPDFKVLTDNSEGTHSWEWSPNKRYLFDTWSRVDLPPQVSLRDAESGEQLAFLEKGELETLEGGATWNAPERFVTTGRDGTTKIYGIIVRPSDFDENKSYPVIEDIYAGPHDFFTPKGFSRLSGQREWADQGYIVVKLDGMGTNWRSKAFHDTCFKNLKDAGFPDRIAWITAAASTRPWMDLSRVGIFGTSAGGQSAAAAVLHHGDFYKVAAADSGCHDNRMDKMWWNEAWMSYPVDESYVESSNATHASKLTGKLMLIVGELDDNVDPSSTLQLVNALNAADKDYELLYVPGGGHGCGGSGYPLRRQRAFFRRHLLNSDVK
jgi:dipeptidyl aminopeptidase/acylaminoacyl peptidase